MRHLPLVPTTARRGPRRDGRRRDPGSRPRPRFAGTPPCRGVSRALRRGRRRGPRGCGTYRAPNRSSPLFLSDTLGYARGRASRRRVPGPCRRARTPSRPVPAAGDLRRPLVYLLAGEDALLDEQLLGPGDPALVVAEVPVVLEPLDGAAVLVCGLYPFDVQGDGDGVGQPLPVLDLVLSLVYGAAGLASEVVHHGYPTLRTSFMGGRSTSSSTYSCNLRPSGVATACR